MKFANVSSDSKIALLAMALAGAIEATTASLPGKGKDELNIILHRIGLTEAEFGAILNDMPEEVALQVISVSDTACVEAAELELIRDEFCDMGTEFIVQGLMDRELITIEESGMSRRELYAVIAKHRKSIPNLLA